MLEKSNLLMALPILALVGMISINSPVTTNLVATYDLLKTEITTKWLTPTLSIDELGLEGDRFSKRKVKRYLQDAFHVDDILHLHTASIELMEQYPKHEAKIRKLTIRVANENGYSLRFHPDDRSIIYRKLTPTEVEKILVEEEEAEELELAEEVTPIQVEVEEHISTPVALSIKAFPNPTTEKVTVSFTGNDTPATLTILDIQGKEVYRKKITPAQNEFQRTIAIGKWIKGMATIRIKQNDQTVQQKVIVVE